MGFKKITLNELKYALYENLIGLPQSIGESKEDDKFNSDFKHKIELSDSSDKKSSNYSIFKAKKILISLDSTRKITLDNKYKIRENQKENWVTVRNPSEQNRIWNVSLIMNPLKEKILLDGIQPGEEVRKEIKVDNKEEDSELKITEKISKIGYIKNPGEVSDFYLESNKENILFFTVFIKNTSDRSLSSIQIEKTLPETTLKILESSVDLGFIQSTRRKILWSIEKLNPLQNAELKFKIQLPEKRSNTGKFLIQYRTSTDNSDEINVENFTATVNTAQFMHINEKDEYPGIWDCGLSVINHSDLEIIISKVKLFAVENHESTLIGEINDKIELNPYQEKTLIENTLKSENQPVLQKEVSYQLGFQKLINKLNIIEIEDSDIEIINISAEMNFSVDSIRSYEKTKFNTAIEILNKSTLPINHIMVKTNFPIDFSYENIADLRIKLGKKSLSLDEFSKNLEIMNPEDELTLLTKKIAVLNDAIQTISEKQENLEKSRSELQKALQIYDESLLNKQKDDYSERLKKLNEELKKNLQFKSNLEKTIDNLKIQLKNLEDNEKGLVEVKNEFEKIEKLNDSILKQKQSMSQIEKNLSKYSQELKDLEGNEKKGEEKDKETVDPIDNNPKIKNLNKKIEDLTKNKKDLLDAIKKLEIEIKTVEKKIDNKQSKSEIEKNIKNLVEKMDLLKKEVNAELQNFKDLNIKISSTESEISRMEIKNKEIIQSIKKRQEINKDLSAVEKEINEVEKEARMKTELVEIDEKRKSKLENIYNPDLQHDQKFGFIKKEFSDGIIESEKAQFETFFLTDNFRQNNLVIIINNIKDIVGEIKPDEKFLMTIPITAIRPRIDINYEYSSEIFYDYVKSSGIQNYQIKPGEAGTLRIIHKRKKISLGKIVNPLPKQNQYSITLIVKNNGRNSVENLKILDFLPQKTEISNSYFTYKEEKSENDLKKISWEISKILPDQEFEISYVATLTDNKFDLYSFELKTE